jgi:hypothetical protein
MQVQVQVESYDVVSKLTLQDHNLLFVGADASERAVGAVLFQVYEKDGIIEQQLISFASQKFSKQAFCWDMFKKEAYTLFFAVKNFAYFLHCKVFVLETDHRNLVWIEKLEVAIVIRWKVYVQLFTFWLRDIPGRSNVVADWQFRMYHIAELLPDPIDLENEKGEKWVMVPAPADKHPPEYYLRQLHGGRNLH